MTTTLVQESESAEPQEPIIPAIAEYALYSQQACSDGKRAGLADPAAYIARILRILPSLITLIRDNTVSTDKIDSRTVLIDNR